MKELYRRLIPFVPYALYLGLTMILIVCLYEKTNLHTDEVSTYVLSNNTINDSITVTPTWFISYDDPSTLWLDAMSVQTSERFNYQNVWEKQASDVHPPLYYALVHTISSLFPERYSIWFAGSINIIFSLLTLLIVRKLTLLLTKRTSTVFVVSCCYIFSAGILSATTFLRMYILAMFLVSFITYLFILQVFEPLYKRYLLLCLISVLGALTHYYFILYLLALFLTYTTYLLLNKQWKHLLSLTLSMFIAALSSITIFPSILYHTLLGGYRGNETLDNLSSASLTQYWSRIKVCLDILNHQLFGGFFFALLIILLVLVLVMRYRGKAMKSQNIFIFSPMVISWLLISTTCLLYFLAVSKVAVFLTDRYFHPVYPLFLVLIVSAYCSVLESLLSKKVALIIVCILMICTTFADYKNNWYYLYRHSSELLNASEQYSEYDCLYVANASYEINPSFYEIGNYKSAVFVPYIEISRLESDILDSSSGFILSVGTACDFETIWNQVQTTWPTINQYKYLGTHSFSETYYVYSTNP